MINPLIPSQLLTFFVNQCFLILFLWFFTRPQDLLTFIKLHLKVVQAIIFSLICSILFLQLMEIDLPKLTFLATFIQEELEIFNFISIGRLNMGYQLIVIIHHQDDTMIFSQHLLTYEPKSLHPFLQFQVISFPVLISMDINFHEC